MIYTHFSKNGLVLSIDQAVMPLSSIEYMYGFGVYETIRVIHGTPYFLSDHADRLMHSARVIELDHRFTKEFVSKSILDLVQTLGQDATCNLKVLLIGASVPQEAQLIVMPLAPLFPNKQMYRDGIKTITTQHERVFAKAKSLNMLPSYVYYRSAKRAGCYDALLVNRKGAVTEGTRTNFFCIKGNTIVMPPEAEILEGVTKKTVQYVAQKHDFILEERDILLADILLFDGAFLTGTSIGIMPIRAIDSITFSEIPPRLRELMKHYDLFKKKCGGIFPDDMDRVK